MKWRILPLLFLLASGCSKGPGATFDGLRVIEIDISEDSYGQLLLGGREKDFVAARLRIGDARYPGQISLSGQGTLDSPKKSFQFESQVDTPLGYRSLKLSAQTQDDSFLRMLIGQPVYQAVGLATPEVEPVALFFNGELSGLYLLIERVNPSFYERRGHQADRLYKSKLTISNFGELMVTNPRSGMESTDSPFHDEEIRRLAHWANTPPATSALNEFQATADTESFIAYFAATVFLWNCDGVDNNIRIFHDPSAGKLFFSPWDWDWTFKPACELSFLLQRNRLVAKILEYPELTTRFKSVLSTLSSEFPVERFDSLIEAEYARIHMTYARDRNLEGNGKSGQREMEDLKRHQRNWRSVIQTFAGSP